VDIAADFRGTYTDLASSRAAIKKIANGTTVADAAAHCAAKHGLNELVHPLMAQRGDLVVAQDGDNLIAGVVHLNGRHVAVAGAKGLQRLSIRSIQRAWRV
jgi:cell wall-associated NlpC family hydrolase